jgi:xylulokinase
MALKWFKNQFAENFSFRELDELAEKVDPGCDGLTMLPHFCGSTMPKYNPSARGSFTGLTTEHTRGHFVRAVMESVACMLRSNLDYLGLSVDEIRVMGGGANSPLWCQMKADMTGKRLVTLKNKETACLGSAILAAVGTGAFSSVEEAAKLIRLDREYTSTGADYSECYARYLAYDKLLNNPK